MLELGNRVLSTQSEGRCTVTYTCLKFYLSLVYVKKVGKFRSQPLYVGEAALLNVFL